jgi:hypothetical protein
MRTSKNHVGIYSSLDLVLIVTYCDIALVGRRLVYYLALSTFFQLLYLAIPASISAMLSCLIYTNWYDYVTPVTLIH